MRFWPCLILIIATACNHTAPFTYGSELGPATSGSDVLLTYNPAPDYWPTLTEDGTGILYAFVDASQNTAAARGHRCIALMPVGGGTRFWQWCDNRAVEADSLSSIPAFALGADGRLIYLEVTTPSASPFAPSGEVLWLADSAQPQQRRPLLTLPATIGDSVVNWLGDLQWTGPASFMAIAERMVLAGHCNQCGTIDDVWYGAMLVSGTLGAGGATLAPIAGTAGATGYALVDNGAAVVFTHRDSTNLMEVPVTGGTPATIVVTPRTGVQLFGVSCRATTCVVALGPVTLWNGPADVYPSINAGAFELRSVSLTTGETTTILSRFGSVLACPLITATGDVVAQYGNMFGHLQTFAPSQSDLHLYAGLVP